MKAGPRDAFPFFLCMVWLSVLGGGWTTVSRAADAPLTPLESVSSDGGADQLLPKEPPLERETPLPALAQKQIPIEEVGDDERLGFALGRVSPLPGSGSTTDAANCALIPATPLGPVESPPVVQSPLALSAHGPASMHPQR
jgi:hypothetical protein